MTELERVQCEVFAAFLRIFGPNGLRLADRIVEEAQSRAPVGRPAIVAEIKRVAQATMEADAELVRMKPAVQVWAAEALINPADDPERAARVRAQTDRDLVDLLFFVCQPSLYPSDALAAASRFVFGLSPEAIASLTREPVDKVSARLERALGKLIASPVSNARPTGQAVARRLDAALMVLHMVFAEADRKSCASELRSMLSHRVIHLCEILLGVSEYNDPSVHALLALCYLHAARLPARTTESDPLLSLATEDRSLWLAKSIDTGRRHFEISISGEMASYFHLEAAIAARHAAAEDFESTDWPQILALWAQLDAIAHSATTVLEKILALAMVEGPGAALGELERFAAEPALASDPRAVALRDFLEARLRG